MGFSLARSMPEGREVRTPRHPLLQRSPRARIGTPPVQRQRPQAPDLTPAQRAVANQAMYSVLARLNAAATNGNTKAADAVEQYRSSK